MDILSHGLWASLIARGANIKTGQRTIHPWWAFFFGLFPDLFAFTIPTAALLFGLLTGDSSIPMGDGHAPPTLRQPGMLSLSLTLYNYSHSLVIFAIVFLAVAAIRRGKPLWELSGWLFHILCDIPTHSEAFFPTPVFWPISHWTFNGFSWGRPWFIALNYLTLFCVYVALRLWQKHHSSYATPKATS